MNPTPCGSGYYTLKTEASTSNDCTICPAGYVCTCTLDGTSSFCDGAASITLCPEGDYCPQGTATTTTGSCAEGYYCPEGTFAEIPCPPGYTCDGTGNSFSSKVLCVGGNYCPGGSTTSTWVECPAGSYCEDGALSYTTCEIGTYNSNTGSDAAAACVACDAQATCNNRGQETPDAAAWSCEAGYYCPDDTTKEECPKGYYCPTDTLYPEVCAAGYYTDNLA